MTGKEKIFSNLDTSMKAWNEAAKIWQQSLFAELNTTSKMGLWNGFEFYESFVPKEPEVFIIRRLY